MVKEIVIKTVIGALELLMFLLALLGLYSELIPYIALYSITLLFSLYNSIIIYDESKDILENITANYRFPFILLLFFLLTNNSSDLALAFVFSAISTIKSIAIWIQFQAYSQSKEQNKAEVGYIAS